MSHLSHGCRRICAYALLTVLGLGASAAALAAPDCARQPAAAPALARLTRVMATGRYVAYQPTQIRIIDGQASRADEAGITADLTVLRPHFDGLITYSVGNGADRVVDVAARLGFRAVILGGDCPPSAVDCRLVAGQRTHLGRHHRHESVGTTHPTVA